MQSIGGAASVCRTNSAVFAPIKPGFDKQISGLEYYPSRRGIEQSGSSSGS